jgi:CBS domain containing-hemolysin-like protein
MFGTWVGTLLAYYFSKESLDSATRNVNELTRAVSGLDKLNSVPAMEKAIPFADIFVPKGSNGVQLTLLAEIITAMQNANRSRFLVFRADKSIERVIHVSTIVAYVSKIALNPGDPPRDLKTLSLTDLLSDTTVEQLTRGSFAVIPQSATLADAKLAMDAKSRELGTLGNCEDVFITADGSALRPVLGWITNDVLVANAKV